MAISKRARFINFLLRRSKIKQRISNEETAMRLVEMDHKRGPPKPSRWLRNHCNVEISEIDGRKVYHFTPKTGGNARHIFYLHGGGYAFNIAIVHWWLIARLIKATDASVTVPLYPLAPEHDWSTSYPTVMKAFEIAADRHGASNIIILGDSAGGGYSLGLSQMRRDEGKSLPGKIVLLSPWLDVTASDPMQAELDKKDMLLSVAGAKTAGQYWAGEGNDPAGFPASPLFASLEGLPSITVLSGGSDILYADALRLAAKGKETGADVTLHIGEDMQHVWMMFPVRESKLAVQQIIDAVLK